MKTLYFRETEELDEKLQKIEQSSERKVESIKLIENESKDVDIRIKQDKKTYEMIEKIPKKDESTSENIDANIVGYIKVYKDEDKTEKIKQKEIEYTLDKKVAVRSKKKLTEKVIGYVEVEKDESLEKAIEKEQTESNTVEKDYIAVVKKRNILIPILIIIILIGCLLFGMRSCGTANDDKVPDTEVSFRDGEKGTGDLETDKTEFGSNPTFRMKLNCTPIVENGKINLRLESPAEDNEGLGFVVKVYLLQKVNDDEVIDDYTEDPVQIYESPLVLANENIEESPLDMEVAPGNYVGRAMYDIYDSENNFVGQTACRLNILVK